MRLIDADYLDNKMFRNCPIEDGGIPLPDFATHTKILKLYPTVDAVPVVRCKDCIHLVKGIVVPCCEVWYDLPTSKDAFCSFGEREDNATD